DSVGNNQDEQISSSPASSVASSSFDIHKVSEILSPVPLNMVRPASSIHAPPAQNPIRSTVTTVGSNNSSGEKWECLKISSTTTNDEL
ncbi:Hypothetical predicted protein, partial [Olea europaea subsp. europaea]